VRWREDPLSGSLYVFFNRHGNYLKLVYWDRTGFSLFAKRLERGRFALPGDADKQELSLKAFELVLDGIVLGGRGITFFEARCQAPVITTGVAVGANARASWP